MRREFVEKVRDHRIYDTRNYRYVYDYITDKIRRLRLEYLDTVKALLPEEWEVMKA